MLGDKRKDQPAFEPEGGSVGDEAGGDDDIDIALETEELLRLYGRRDIEESLSLKIGKKHGDDDGGTGSTE